MKTPSLEFRTHAKRHFEHYAPTSRDAASGVPLIAQSVRTGRLDWRGIQHSPCIVLLGEPNIGKSREFEHQRQQLLANKQRAVITRLKDWLPDEDILQAEAELKEALDSGEEFHWFVDALDEGRLQWPQLFAGLFRLLRDLHRESKLGRMRLRLSCRAREWKQHEQERLATMFEDPKHEHAGLVAVRMLPIDEDSARELIAEKLGSDIQVQRFIQTCRSNNVQGLAGFPLLLASMLQQFEATGSLASNRTELFRQASASLLNERNTLHREEGKTLASEGERQRMADALAAQCVLTGTLVFGMDKAYEMVSDANSSASLASMEVLKQVLGSGLFTQHGSREHEFVHRSFADFGAARAFSEALDSNRPLRAILPAFSLQEDGIPDQMRDTASFLAGMNAKFRDWLIENDPLGACNGDTRSYPPATRAHLIKVLETRFSGLSYQGQFTRYGDLAYEMPIVEARRLLERSNATAVRALALGLIASCPSPKLLEPMLDVALDASETPDFRVYAVTLLCSVAARDYADRLKSGVALSRANDPEDEVAGALLAGLYPEFMSVDEALALFHVPRSAMHGKRYKDFWSTAFWSHNLNSEQRHRALQVFSEAFQHYDKLADDAPVADRQRILGGMTRGVRSVFEAFCQQLVAEADAPGRNISILGPWLLTASNWSRRHMSLSPLALSGAPYASELRAEVLRWAAAAAPTDRVLRPSSDIPYFRDAYGIDDLDLLLTFIRDHVDQPRISVPLFSSVLGLWLTSATEDNKQNLTLVAELSPELMSAAEKFNEAWRQSEEDRQAHFEMLEAESDARGESPHRPLDSAEIEVIKAGSVEGLLEELVDANTDFASQQFSQRLEALPAATREAAQKGALAAWSTFSDSSVLWTRNDVQNTFSIPPGVQSAIVGFWLHCKTLETDDDLQLTPSQAELMIWMARESHTDFERLLGAVWERSKEVTRFRLRALLEAEDQQSHAVGQTLWLRLRGCTNLPSDLVQFVKTFALGHLEAKSAKVRALLFAFLRRHASTAELRDVVPSLEATGLAGVADNLDGSAEELALRSLAMAWLIDDASIGRVGFRVFSGPNHLRRARSFTGAISEITQPGPIPLGWAEPIDIGALAGLVPHLYFKNEKAQAGSISQISMLSRDHVFHRMLEAKDDGPQVLTLFAKWKDDERFEDWRTYLTEEHAKLQRRLSEEAWTPMHRDAAAALLRRQGNVVRGTRDVVYFLDELIETRLLPSFRTDYSLTPLLWGKRGTDSPRDEKDVQTAVYGLLRNFVQVSNVVGAREPEQSDGKKPDIRFDFADTRNVCVPIEIKWSHHADLWIAMEVQLVQLYMKDPEVTYGVYLVAWSGRELKRPDGVAVPSAEALQVELRKLAAEVGVTWNKTISVFVIDATVSPEMKERLALMKASPKRRSRAKKAPAP